MFLRRVMCVLVGVTTTILLIGRSYATIVPQMALSELISTSSYIVVGTVVLVDSTVGIEGPETLTEIRVEEDFGTKAPSTINYRLPEGQFNERHVSIESAPKVLPKTRYLIFFRQGPWSLTPYSNWHYGVFVLGEEYIFNLDGQCLTNFDNDLIHFGERLRYPEPVLGPVIDEQQLFFQSTPDETDFPWIEADIGNCGKTTDLLKDLDQLIKKHHVNSLGFHSISFRDGANIAFEANVYSSAADSEMMCKIASNEELVCDAAYLEGDFND